MAERKISLLELKEIDKEARKLALINVNEMSLPSKLSLPETVVSLGHKIKKNYDRIYSGFESKDEDEFHCLVANTNKGYWFACHEAANILRLQFASMGYSTLNETQKRVSTAEGIADSDGWAYTFFNSLSYIENKLDTYESLNVMALYWFAKADESDDLAEKFNLVSESFNAISLANGTYMFSAGFEKKTEDVSERMRDAALKRNKENHMLKQDAIAYWCENIDLKLSNEGAAAILTKVIPLGHRKLAEYVSEAKRLNLHPASKA